MEKSRGGFHTLYQREYPHIPGLPLAKHFDLAKVNDKIPSEAELEAALQRLRPHSSGVHTHLRAEHFKKWQRKLYPGEHSKTPPEREK